MKLLPLAACLLVALPAHAEIAEVQWGSDGSAAREFSVAPGKFFEWCTKLRRGEKVRWQFDAGATPLDFNVHYHEGKDVRFPAKHDGIARAEGAVEVAVDQDYCWMWSSKRGAQPATVKASLVKHR